MKEVTSTYEKDAMLYSDYLLANVRTLLAVAQSQAKRNDINSAVEALKRADECCEGIQGVFSNSSIQRKEKQTLCDQICSAITAADLRPESTLDAVGCIEIIRTCFLEYNSNLKKEQD